MLFTALIFVSITVSRLRVGLCTYDKPVLLYRPYVDLTDCTLRLPLERVTLDVRASPGTRLMSFIGCQRSCVWRAVDHLQCDDPAKPPLVTLTPPQTLTLNTSTCPVTESLLGGGGEGRLYGVSEIQQRDLLNYARDSSRCGLQSEPRAVGDVIDGWSAYNTTHHQVQLSVDSQSCLEPGVLYDPTKWPVYLYNNATESVHFVNFDR